jgi:cyclopropane fatty-acyl-phospholipid synthase-like methyltransferase
VDAVDFSSSSIAQAKAAALKNNSTARFHCQSIFDFNCSASSYDLVYDSGCFHHIAPHRRPEFLDLVSNALRPGGLFAMVCFAPGGGSDYSDRQVYENRSMGGGLSFTEESIRHIFSEHFSIVSFRRMKELPESSGLFGKDFLWVTTMRKRE